MSAPGQSAGSEVEELLFLAHRIPYPPNKGDKVRSFHILKALAGRYRVRLGAFVDDPADLAYGQKLGRYCTEVRLLRLRPLTARVRSLGGLATGRALTLPYFRDRVMAAWVRARLATGSIRRVLVYSSAMAQYVERAGDSLHRVVDLVDVDSDKWRQYAARSRWPMSSIYGREARRLLAYERRIAAAFDAAVLVSGAEAELFRTLAPETAARVHAIENGVDAQFFRPDREYADPYGPGGPVLVFTGAMDYRANVDAVDWFAAEVFPRLRERLPQARFFIVGARPVEAVRRLAARPGVAVTGSVPDIRPYLAHAALAVAPLRLARGIQNKVLEAMAMGRPLVASPEALDGLDLGPHAPSAPRNVDQWVEALSDGLARPGPAPHLREWVQARYDWGAAGRRFAALLEGARDV